MSSWICIEGIWQLGDPGPSRGRINDDDNGGDGLLPSSSPEERREPGESGR